MTRAGTGRQTILHPISPGNNDNGGDGSSKSGLLAGIAGAGIASLAIGAIAFLAQKLGIITINPNAWRNFFH